MLENKSLNSNSPLGKNGDTQYKEIVELVGDLPPMPAVAAKAIKLVEDPCITAKKLNDVLSADASLTARLLKISNSAMFARQREITTLTQAIMTIGFKSLKGIIVAAAVRQINKSSSKYQKIVWENAVATAMATTMISNQLKKRYREEIYVFGLLHTLGQMAFLNSKKVEAKVQDIFKLIKEKSFTYVEAENAVLGFNHTIVGALIAKKWNFSEETCDSILNYQNNITKIEDHEEQKEKHAILLLSDLLSHSIGLGSPEGYPDKTEEIKRLMLLLNLADKGSVDDVFEELKVGLKQKFEFDAQAFS
jgi:HD-like signal output (HDOD) protein